MKAFPVNKNLDIALQLEEIPLQGLLHVPTNAHALVIFVHGSGSSRFSTRNQHVATILNKANVATLLFDLLAPEEDKIDAYTREFRFNIKMLASRLIATTDWVLKQPDLQDFAIGYFGASTGGAAALVAATQKSNAVKAIVSRGGRPDLAGAALPGVEAPTLLIVGGDDNVVIEMNQSAMHEMHCIKQLEIIPGATHLFEEPGKLDIVAALASAWFEKYLQTSSK